MALKTLSLVAAALVVIVGIFFYVNDKQASAPATNTEELISPQTRAANFDKSQYSLKEPSSLWVIVNKQNALPTNYVPQNLIVPNVRLRLNAREQQMQLSKKAQADLEAMFVAASKEGVKLVFGSGYRSASLQQQFYNSYVAQDGQAAADRYSARPGHSEHQSGLGVDITSLDGKCHLEICWEQTEEGKWIAQNAHRYGFIIRYPKSKKNITGYQYEPWHLRYVGRDLAAEIKVTGQTLEEFFGWPAAPDYN